MHSITFSFLRCVSVSGGIGGIEGLAMKLSMRDCKDGRCRLFNGVRPTVVDSRDSSPSVISLPR
jgi:hypothetical protein